MKFLSRISPALLVLILFFGFAPDANAAEPSTQQQVEAAVSAMLVIALNFMNMILWPFLLMIGDLMDSKIIIGPGMEDVLREIWVQVRNLVNIGFVVVLILIAFYNVLGLGSEGNLALKTALPKLIIGLVAVNFTFLGGKLIIDVASLATTAAFALPEVVDQSSDAINFEKQKNDFIYKVCVPSDGTAYTEDNAPPITKIFCSLDASNNYTPDLNNDYKPFFSRLNANNIGVIMAVNMGALEKLNAVKADGVFEFRELVINGLFSLLMFIIFAVSYIVLGLVLIFRAVVLWVAIALSPIAVLFYVVPQLKEQAGGGADFAGKVTKHIIAPIVIGLILSIGFIMVEALQGVVGSASSSLSSSATADIFSKEFLVTGIADMQHLLIAITCIVIVWEGVFQAASGTYAEGITGTIKSTLLDWGKTGIGLAQYAQIIPSWAKDEHGGGMQKMSVSDIGMMKDDVFSAFRQKERNKYLEKIKDTPLGKYINLKNLELSDVAEHPENYNDDHRRDIVVKNIHGWDEEQIRHLVPILTTLAETAKPAMVEEVKNLSKLGEADFKTNFERLAKGGAFGYEWSDRAGDKGEKLRKSIIGEVAPEKPTRMMDTMFTDAKVKMPVGINFEVPVSFTVINDEATDQAVFTAKISTTTKEAFNTYITNQPKDKNGKPIFDVKKFLTDKI